MMEGWIAISRGIESHWIWKDASYLKWWVYLLLHAQWEDCKVLNNKQLIEIKRGQLLQSVRGLAVIWGVDKKRAFKFIEMLQKDGMIRVHNMGHQHTIITICNYDSYQVARDTNGDTNGDINGDTNGDTKQEKKKKNQKENKEEFKQVNNISVLSSSKEEYKPLAAADFLEKGKEKWKAFYKERTGLKYYWTSKDSKLMKELMEKVAVNTPEKKRTEEELVNRLDLFLRHINDSWTNERLSVQMVNMKFNELMQQMVKKKR